MDEGNGLEAGKWAAAVNAHGLMAWLFAHQGDECLRGCVCVYVYVCEGAAAAAAAGHSSAL